jgi:DNA invertase Pin-like site-specific DNA recombinase
LRRLLVAGAAAVFRGLAEFERELIRARTTEGRIRAVVACVRMGRKPSLSPPQRQHAVEMREAGKSYRRSVTCSAYLT